MESLNDFRNLGFLEQISLLAELEADTRTDVLPQLLEFYITPIGDAAVDTMIRNCIRTLMLADYDAVLQGLASDNKQIMLFSMGIAAESGLSEAAPALLELAGNIDDPDDLLDVLTAMSKIRVPEFLPVFKQNMGHQDPLVAALCLEMMGTYQDHDSLPELVAAIRQNEEEDRFSICEITTWSAIVALGKLASTESIQALASLIHHKNPTARRLIHETLRTAGKQATLIIGPMLSSGTGDVKLMVLNLLGQIADRKGCDYIIDALEKGWLDNANMVFAAYEALGSMPGMKSLVCLTDALETEDDPLIITAIIGSLDGQAHQATANKIKQIIVSSRAQQPAKGKIIVQAIITSRAGNLFALLHDDAQLMPMFTTAIADQESKELSDFYIRILKEQGSDAAGSLALELRKLDTPPKHRHVLAIDDSMAMRNFYQMAAPQTGLSVHTASNGREALEILRSGMNSAKKSCPSFDLIVVDLNMPVMDGLEFSRKLREIDGYKAIPVLMATTESDKSQAALARQSGINAFLNKPFTIETLQNTINTLLGA